MHFVSILIAVTICACTTKSYPPAPPPDDKSRTSLDSVAVEQSRGRDCSLASPCQPNFYCDIPATDDCGVCMPTLPDGAACSVDAPCGSNYCTTAGLCAPLGQLGDACGDKADCKGSLLCNRSCVLPLVHAEGDACKGWGDCGLDLFCSEKTNRCHALNGLGEDCTLNLSCESKYCNSETQKCAPPTIVKDQCSVLSGCICEKGSFCNIDEICEREPGSTCDPQEPDSICGPYLECKDTGVCGSKNYSGACPQPSPSTAPKAEAYYLSLLTTMGSLEYDAVKKLLPTLSELRGYPTSRFAVLNVELFGAQMSARFEFKDRLTSYGLSTKQERPAAMRVYRGVRDHLVQLHGPGKEEEGLYEDEHNGNTYQVTRATWKIDDYHVELTTKQKSKYYYRTSVQRWSRPR